MGNIAIQNNDLGSEILYDGVYDDDIVRFEGPDTFVAGTIMARHAGTGKLGPYIDGDINLGTPSAILTYELQGTAPADVPARVAIGGKFRREKLVVFADGDATIIDPSLADALRVFGLMPLGVNELNKLDNQ
jgi:hypothetical protein